MTTPSPLFIHPKTPITITPSRKVQQKGLGFNFIKSFARFVSRMFFWKKKANSGKDQFSSMSTLDHVHDPDYDEDDQVGDLSWSRSTSTGTSSKSSSKFRNSSSYGSSSVNSSQLGLVNLSFDEIYTATGKFSSANIIGEGGFGTVYKGKLKNGLLVAVKRAKKDINGQKLSTEFKNEILTLSKIEHNKLVKYFGCIEHKDEKIIVVEYITNGTLRQHLDGKFGNEFEIAERLDIVIDVAHALAYLHTYSDPPIIHRDVKSSNILITEKFTAKVADFGFAREVNDDATHVSTQVKGTCGYLDPEYLRTYQLTEKSDVYSFGVVLLEIVTGRYPIEPEKSIHEKMTVKWVLQRLKHGEAVIVMDPRLRRSPASIEVVEKVLRVAKKCLNPSRQFRPSMRVCAEVLWGIRRDLQQNYLVKNAKASHNSDIITKDVRNNGHDSSEIGNSSDYRFCSA